MRIPYYEVDAFTDSVFGGNPAGVCLLEKWLPDEMLQSIAAENNLSETAFVLGGDGRYALRWFTPTIEVDLCGHATLASARVLFEGAEAGRDAITFETRSGELTVTRNDGLLALDFPSLPPEPCDTPSDLVAALGAEPAAVLKSRDYLVVYDTEDEVRGLEPDFAAIGRLDTLGVIVTAPGTRSDFVSRFFAPRAGIDEDPVTGSAHCTLTPYWSERLGRRELRARQISRRGGDLLCEDCGERCTIAGSAVIYLEGSISV